ncbi:uncharacterized protein MELLADRAFT_96233 [Melampsora larici-populina 98AG31]|uniref:Alpha-type protein kinase domain-containing protein n=1 Tax=Melampsora larici-populina (strain 98AG31 / pathotype 3-4-7) TaxID=747676 RepID=F4SBE6_MELLP|nr:uncharacterized protein MELLADRAFT_96233 [Melampsora larici-populina 98AG31]EGF98016.1 hypothetical protein MELLADRAFT_96233 [Melampsora larici-populina 98AG31]
MPSRNQGSEHLTTLSDAITSTPDITEPPTSPTSSTPIIESCKDPSQHASGVCVGADKTPEVLGGTDNQDENNDTQSETIVRSGRTSYKARAPRAVRHSNSEVALGPGFIILVSNPIRTCTLRPDLPSKRAAFLYHMKYFYGEGSNPTYEPTNCTALSEAVVLFQLGNIVDFSKSRDVNEWQARELQGDGVEIPYASVARFHFSWSYSATSGRERALELVNAHIYVASMLKLFKARLHQMWKEECLPEGYLAQQFREWFIRAAALHVPRVSCLQTIGSLDDDVPRWMLVEVKPESVRTRYVYQSCFRDTLPKSDPWKALLFAFIHYAYQHSGGVTLIGQIDCDQWGSISNVLCFNKASYYLENSDRMDMPFFDFRGGHQCDQICKEMGLARLTL